MPLHVVVKRGSATTSQTQNIYWQNMTSTDLTGQLEKVWFKVALYQLWKSQLRPT